MLVGVLVGVLIGVLIGVLVSDFYGGYNDTPGGRHPRCWAHLLRDAHALAEAAADDLTLRGLETRAWVDALLAVWRRVQRARTRPAAIPSHPQLRQPQARQPPDAPPAPAPAPPTPGAWRSVRRPGGASLSRVGLAALASPPRTLDLSRPVRGASRQ